MASIFNSLKERWNAEETKIGKFLKSAGATILAALAACTAIIENINVLPDGFVSPQVKMYLGYAAVASFFLGKFTKKSSSDSAPNSPS